MNVSEEETTETEEATKIASIAASLDISPETAELAEDQEADQMSKVSSLVILITQSLL